MADIDFKAATPDTSLAGTEFLLGADSQAASEPSIYSLSGIVTYLATLFASAAQGTAADSAVQPGDLGTVATSNDYDDLDNLPTLGTAAAAATGDFATAGHNHNGVYQPLDTVLTNTTASFLTADETKLDGIEALADVTDATNVAAAGAFMKSVDDSDDLTEGATKLLMTSAERTRLGLLGTAGTPEFAAVNLSHASATTLTGASGVAFVESLPLAFRRPTINSQTGTSYTLALTDEGNIVTMSNGSANLLTIPPNGTIALPVGTIINVIMLGAGVTSIKGDTGVTLNGVSAGTGAIAARYSGAALLKTASDTWILSGNVGTVA